MLAVPKNDNHIHCLSRKISILSWDIPIIADQKIKAMRQKELEAYKAELASITQQERC